MMLKLAVVEQVVRLREEGFCVFVGDCQSSRNWLECRTDTRCIWIVIRSLEMKKYDIDL